MASRRGGGREGDWVYLFGDMGKDWEWKNPSREYDGKDFLGRGGAELVASWDGAVVDGDGCPVEAEECEELHEWMAEQVVL